MTKYLYTRITEAKSPATVFEIAVGSDSMITLLKSTGNEYPNTQSGLLRQQQEAPGMPITEKLIERMCDEAGLIITDPDPSNIKKHLLNSVADRETLEVLASLKKLTPHNKALREFVDRFKSTFGIRNTHIVSTNSSALNNWLDTFPCFKKLLQNVIDTFRQQPIPDNINLAQKLLDENLVPGEILVGIPTRSAQEAWLEQFINFIKTHLAPSPPSSQTPGLTVN